MKFAGEVYFGKIALKRENEKLKEEILELQKENQSLENYIENIRKMINEYCRRSDKYDFKEIFKLKNMLDREGMKYTFIDRTINSDNIERTFYHIRVYENEKSEEYDDCFISIIQNFGSIGREKDLLEIKRIINR